MAPLNRKSLAECKTKVLYRAWKGQLFIQDQQLCDVVLQSPFSISIPAQLPAKLEIRHAVDVSELRKKLPEAALRRKNYADHEVRYQDTLFYLYEVEISNQNELKVEQLIESMKEKKLALIKYLNDQGALILLSSSAFVKEKDADTDEPSCLQALFLISSPGPQCSAAKDWKCEWRGNERSLQVSLVLPGLHYALLEAAKHPDREGPPPGTLVKRQIREFAKRHKNSHSVSDGLDSPSVSFDMFSKKSDLDALSEKCLQNSFAHLQFYLLHPQNYTLEMSAAVACLDASSQSPSRSSSSNAQNPDSSSGLDLDLMPPEASEISTRSRRAAQLNLHSNNAAAKTSQTSDRPLQWCKRKSSRLLGASVQKMWAPMKSACIMESSKNRKKSKKKKKRKSSPSPPPAKAPESPAESKELMLKLKNIQYPLRRKRGAEVLSAEFVQGTRSESPVKAPSSSDSPAVTEKRPRLVKLKKDEEKAKSEERTEIRRPFTRQSAQRCLEEARLEAQKELGDKSDPEGEKTTTQDPDPDPSENKEECDSHALNMLADLALSSCNSPLVGNGDQSSLVLSSLQEHRHLPGEMLQNSSDHEYHRDMKKLESTSLSGTSCQHSISSLGEGSLSPELPSSSQEGIRMSTRKKGNVKPGSMKSLTVLPREAADSLDPNIQSLISVEHSYASPTLDSSKKGSPGSPDSKNGVKYLKSGPLALPGKVLPFRHQQNICHPHKQLKNSVQFIRSAIMAARLKEDFSKSHKVTFRDRTVKVTFQWEAEYLFSLDSKYTNNSLEKTVVRAVHGPWDVSQSNDIEEMKLILNMWVALFYSKPIRSSTARKVVEHSNPAKYISLNSVIDPLELIDDSEGAYSLDKCPADSLSMTNLAPSEVKERAIFPSAKPPSCNKLSSTNSIKDEFLCANPKEPHNVPLKGEELQTTARSSEDTVSPLDKVVGGKPERESVLDSVLPFESPHRNPSRNPSGGCSRPQKLRVDAVSESGGVVNLGEVSQADAAPADAKFSENSGNEKQRENIEAGTSAENWETSGASPLAEKKKESHQTGGIELLPTSEVAWLEASAQEDGGPPCGKVIESQDLPMDEEDGVEESVEWESIDLALSDSNETDGESRDGDLEQDGEELPEETGSTEEKETGSVCGMVSPAESLLTSVTSPATVSEYQMELPSTEEDSIASRASFASLSQKNIVEGFSLSRENTVDSRVDSVPPQASSVQGEEMELPASEDTSVSAKHPNQMDVDENSFLSWGNKGSKSVDSASAQGSKLFQTEKDLETQGKLERDQDSLVSVRNPLFPNPDDLTDISCDSMEERDLNLANSVSPQAGLVHHMSSDAVVELPGGQEASTEPTKHHIFLNRMDLIEDISQDDIHLEDSAPLQPCEGYQTQNSMLTQREATKNQEDSVPSAQSLAPAKEIVLMQDSCVPQKEKGIRLVDAARLPGGPDHQTSDGVRELVGNQEDPSASATALPEPVDLAEDSCISPEKKVHHLQAKEAVQIQQTRAIIKAQNTRKTELLDDSLAEKEFQSLEVNNRRFVLNSEEQKCCDKDENTGASPATQEVTSGYKINEVAVTVSEEVKSVLGELIDTVSAMTIEHEETCPPETSSSNWIRSVTLECVTPPDSEEETTTTDHLNEDLEQHSTFAYQEKAISQGRELYHSALHENMRYGQVNMFERRTRQGVGPASCALDILPSSSGTDWSAMSTSLLCKSPFVKIVTPKEDDPTASMLGKTEVRQISHQPSMSEGEDQFSEGRIEILPCVPTEPQIEHMDGDTRDGLAGSEDVWCTDARQSLEGSGDALEEIRTKSLSSPEETLASEKAQLPARASSGMNKDWEDESFPVDGDQEHVGSSYPSDKAGGPCSTRSTAVPQSMVAGYVSDLGPEEEIHESGGWRYLENTDRLSAPEPEAMEHDWPLVFKEGDRSLDTKNEPGPLKDYVNFSVTKKHKEKTRTFHSSKRHESFMGELGLINSLNRTWRIWNDPTQNTLDMECLRFHYKVKQVLRKPQLPTSTDAFAKELSPPLIAGTLPLRKVPETPPLNPPPRSRSPLLITVVNPSLRHGVSHWYPRRSRYRDSFEPPPFASSQDSLSKAARSKSQGQGSVAPFHLNKLTYKNKLKDSRGDISVIMDEFAEFSRVMTSGNRLTSNKGREPSTTSEDAPEKRGPSLPKRTASYEHLFTELCNTLHFRLKNVAQEACKKTYAFYLMETGDDPFFGRVKNLLKKGGHTEMEPLLFCKANHVETERLMVIIRNEDIFPHVHKIPCLLRLKQFPSVTFAGIDSPEDPLDHTYQELFQNGGFVVSDDKVLEMMTVGLLKEMVKTLEKLNGHGRWRWLLHYKEMKKLREDARVDPAAHAKESLLKSCQGANITEALHYHQCDSRAALRSEHMNCLLNLQVQHISQRFAVFLTEKPSTSREALENKGILALDVNTFIATAEDMAAPFRGSNY